MVCNCVVLVRKHGELPWQNINLMVQTFHRFSLFVLFLGTVHMTIGLLNLVKYKLVTWHWEIFEIKHSNRRWLAVLAIHVLTCKCNCCIEIQILFYICFFNRFSTVYVHLYALTSIFLWADIIHSGESLSVKKDVKMPTQGAYTISKYLSPLVKHCLYLIMVFIVSFKSIYNCDICQMVQMQTCALYFVYFWKCIHKCI